MNEAKNLPTVAATVAEDHQYLTFLLSSEMFAIPILNIKEIIEFGSLTEVPMMPGFIRGVINLRGKVIPVIDLRVKFKFPKAEFNERTCMIVVSVKLPSTQPALVGLIVDVVEEVMSVNSQDMEAAPNFGTKLDTEYILGMAKTKDSVKTILDIDRVVTADTLRTLSDKTDGRTLESTPP